MDTLLTCVALRPTPDDDDIISPAAEVPRTGLLPGAGGLVTARQELSGLALMGGLRVENRRTQHK